MYQLTQLGNDPKQEIEMLLDDGSRVRFYFEYKANQLGWFFGFQYQDINYQNIRLTTSYNILRAYRNYLPFGLRCDTPDMEEPIDLDDFISGYATVYLLTKQDVQTITVEYPFSLDFKTSNGINLSNAGQCNLRLYNLPEDVQKKLYKDNWNNSKYILMELCAGYQDTLPIIFFGYVNQCYSYRKSGAVDYVTEIQADNNSLIAFWGFANQTISKDTEMENVLKVLFKNAPGVEVGYITSKIKPLKRDKTFIGQTLDLLGREYGGYDIYLDKNEINILDANEVVPGDILVISDESGLLGSPRRAEQFLEIEMLFEPRIKIGQAIQLQSYSLDWFNQIYKVVAVAHQGSISPVECGKVITTITLSLGDSLFEELRKSTKEYGRNH